jgi:5-methylcytosine-specific restriction endonuclease McrA
MIRPVLILNADYMPMDVIGWQKAISMWISDKVEIIEEYTDEDITSVKFTMKCPAVVRLVSYVKGFSRRRVRFSRLHLYSRDRFTCQYCNIQPGLKSLTLDHIVPRSEGGKTCWENIVAACKPCNYKKANMSLHKSGMVLYTKPREPTVSEYLTYKFLVPKTPEAWRNYLYWNVEIQ